MMIIRARTVLPMLGPAIDDGAVAVEGNKIADIGRYAYLNKQYGGIALDLGEQVLLPGLINAHCHLDYTILRGKIAPQNSFADWIRAINAEKAKLTEPDYIDSIKAGFAEAARFGTTAIVNLAAFPKLAGAIAEPIRTWWFGELIDVRNPDRADQIADEAAASLKSKKHWGLAPHAPFTASPRLYARCEEIARKENVRLTTHLSESLEEMQMSFNRSGPLIEFLTSIGADLFEHDGETPARHLSRACRLDDRWILAHLNSVLEGDLTVLASSETKPHLVHCPRSHSYFRHEPFELELFRQTRFKFNVCLGTDSLASNPDLSLLGEMRELLRKHPSVSPREALEMATINGAAALGQPNALGCLASGAYADIIALPIPSGGDVYENIVSFSGDVPWMMIDGAVVASR
jgi:cytosine/adenosine deaminase-related metal-dependent hydrolase